MKSSIRLFILALACVSVTGCGAIKTVKKVTDCAVPIGVGFGNCVVFDVFEGNSHSTPSYYSHTKSVKPFYSSKSTKPQKTWR